jgi:hypothetical protein
LLSVLYGEVVGDAFPRKADRRSVTITIKIGRAHKDKTTTASDGDWRVEDHVTAQESFDRMMDTWLKPQKGGAEGKPNPTTKMREGEYPMPGRHDVSESTCKVGRNFHALDQKCQPYGLRMTHSNCLLKCFAWRL